MGLLNIIRRMHLRRKLSIREIARLTGVSRNTVTKHLAANTIEPKFSTPERHSKLDPFAEKLAGWLKTEAGKSRKQRRTVKQLHADLVVLGFTGSYARVAAFARRWRADRQREQQTTGRGTFVPLHFDPGEAFQFDWSEDFAVLGGERTKLQVAHIKLSHSRAFLLRAYPLQTHEMLFDAHWHAFRVFGGVPGRGIYDNMRTAVDRVGRGKERQVNIRFLAMANHYVFEPEFCNPAAGWEKGQVEKNVRDSRHQMLHGMPDFADLAALNAWLEQRCLELWRETAHGTLPGTIADVWAEEQAALMPLPAAFDGFIELSKRVSPTCLISFERNRYSVPASFANRPVSLRIYPDRLVVAAEGNILCEHARVIQRNHQLPPRTIYDWRHYLAVVQRKPGALRNGAPFLELPPAFRQLQDHMLRKPGGDREMVDILALVLQHDEQAVLTAVELALEEGVPTKTHVLNNPVSSVYGGRMVHVPECAAWTWDARPYPFFPALTDVWTDGANWRLGHWLTGRLGAVSLAALVRHLCLRAGLPEDRIDVAGLWGAVEGYAITALESPRASITTLARHFGFDAVEAEGVIRFVMRGRAAVASVTHDDLVAPREGDVLELTRAQETELPQALKWQVARADEDYDAALVEARRITVDTTRIASESFPMAVPPEEAERRCRRALMEAWTGRESAAFRLPPSRLALDPSDVVMLAHDGRSIPLRLISIADADARGIEAVRQDREAYDLPPGAPRPSALSQALVFGAPETVLLDLPQLTEDQAAHRPFAAAHAVPWPGEIAVYRSPSTDGFDLLTTFGSRARIGKLVSDLYAGPTSRFDLGNALVVDLLTGTLESVTDLTLFGGANALAIESAPGAWEIVQAGAAELIAPGRYRLTRLLRGQRGTEGAMGNPAPVGARVVVLDTALASLPIAEADLGIPWNWRIGPASRPVNDETYAAKAFTPEGVGLRPFSVAHVEQPWRRPRAPGDLTIRWTRRSRALAADSWGAVEVPLAEESETYEVEILGGATVKRVLSTTTTSAVYTAAQQAADWGAPLGTGDTLDIRIFQLSALVGRGAPKTVTLQL